jgi:hypothetical protein
MPQLWESPPQWNLTFARTEGQSSDSGACARRAREQTKQISAIPPSFHRAHLLQNSHDSSSIQHQRRVEPASLVNA